MARLAFLGTGMMGAALSEASAKRGDDVTVWNRTRDKAEPLRSFGVTIADSPEAALRGAERAHLVLSNDSAVDAVLDVCGDQLKNVIAIDHSTVSPVAVAERAERLQERGVSFLHAPLLMSPSMCRTASGLMLVSGPNEVFERAALGLQKMTQTLHYLGPRADLAAANKLFGNLMLLAVTAGLSDVLALATALGVRANDALDLFNAFDPAAVLQYRGKAMASGNYEPQFALTMARKDVDLMLGSGRDAVFALLPAIAERMDQLIERGLGEADLGALSADALSAKRGERSLGQRYQIDNQCNKEESNRSQLETAESCTGRPVSSQESPKLEQRQRD